MNILRIFIFIFCWSSLSAQTKPETNTNSSSDSAGIELENIREKYKNSLSRITYYRPESKSKPYDFIHDYEKIFTDNEEEILDSIVTEFEKRTSVEIAIVTFDTMLVSKEDFDSLTLLVANKWGVGKEGKDNGIIIGICTGYRTIRIQNGYGIEKVLTDEQTKAVIDNEIKPYYKKGEYFNGTKAGLLLLINHLK